eukprot:8958426-Heterocapsa_arctica.AAC.1
MRAVNGHSVDIDARQLTTPILPEHAHLMSALRHKTKLGLLPGIFMQGIIPGGLGIGRGRKRGTSNCCAYLSHDPRNKVVGRIDHNYDAVIVLKTADTIWDKSLTLAHNG